MTEQAILFGAYICLAVWVVNDPDCWPRMICRLKYYRFLAMSYIMMLWVNDYNFILKTWLMKDTHNAGNHIMKLINYQRFLLEDFENYLNEVSK